MNDWPKYRSHKIIQAARIVAIDPARVGSDACPRAIWVLPEGGTEPEHFVPTVAGMADKAEVGGYAMEYEDGFRSVSPQKQFEEGYTRVDEIDAAS